VTFADASIAPISAGIKIFIAFFSWCSGNGCRKRNRRNVAETLTRNQWKPRPARCDRCCHCVKSWAYRLRSVQIAHNFCAAALENGGVAGSAIPAYKVSEALHNSWTGYQSTIAHHNCAFAP